MSKNIRLGIIGLGNIAQQHIANIQSGAVQGFRIKALSSRNETSLTKELNALHFSNYKDLIDSDTVDAILIATPTLSHFEIAKYALQKDLHVMLEKPIGL